jgi:hypothetical protein
MRIENNSSVSIDKVLITLGFILLFPASLIIAKTPVATGYEISIYQAYPFYFWMLVIGSIFCGIILLIKKSFSAQAQPRLFLGGYVLLIFTNVIIILLPLFRGYFIRSQGDEITHLGWIVDIINTGHIGITNIYPISHILSTQIALIGGLDIRIGMIITTVCFYVLYAFGLLLLARNIAKRQAQIYFILAFGSVLLFTFYNYLYLPTQNIVFILPLVLYLFLRISAPGSLNFAICFIIILFLLPVIHPLGSLFVCAIFIIINLATHLSRKTIQKNNLWQSSDTYSPIKNWGSVILVFVLFYIWFSQFNMLEFTVTRAWESLILGERLSPMAGIEEGISTIYSSFRDLLARIIMNYGQVILFAVLSIISILILLKKRYFNRESLTSLEIFLSLCFIILCLLGLSTFLNSYLGTGTSLRVFCWPLVASIMLIGLVFHDQLLRLSGRIKQMTLGIVIVIILVSSTLGVLNTFFSPLIDSGDAQVTRSEWQSMEWYLKYKANFRTFFLDQLPVRASHYYYGKDAPKPSSVGFFSDAAEYLRHDIGLSLKDTLPMRGYVVITDREMVITRMLHPTSGAYTLEELNRVFTDPGVNVIFTCAGTNIGYVAK